MGYQIFTGQRLETLVEDHLELFQAGFFGPRPGIILQNQSLAQWLKLLLAQRVGGYATGDFLYQDEALRRLMEGQIPASERLLFLDELKFELYRYLSLALAPGFDPVFWPLTEGGRTPDPLRLFELADHIAGVFHNYAMNSNLWPRALAEGVLPFDSGADPAAFAWQSRLWQDLLIGGRGTLAGLVMDRLTQSPPVADGTPVRLVLLGSAFLSHRALAFLRAWADAGLIDVVHLLLLPAPASPRAWPERRPWSSWGAFGREFLHTMPPMPPDRAASQTYGPSALGRLQSSLADGEDFLGATPDGTLEIVSCPHPLRELELLRDRLLAALSADPALDMNEIAVLAPDINVYAPFLDAAFGSDDLGRSLRFHVIDLDLGRENTWFRALDALLTLVSGTMDRPSLFALTDTPAFRESWKVDVEELDLWLDYTQTVSAWREEAVPAPQSWTASWDRLFSGWFLPPVDSEPMPLDTAPSVFRDLGRFHQLVESLKDRERQARRPRSFLDWIRFLDDLVAEFLAPGEGTGAVLSGRLRTLATDAESGQAWPWAGFRAFVQDQIAHFPGRRGQLLTEGIHCSSLKPLRSIPFKVLAILGLDEGRFPRQTPQASFDLRRFEPGQEGLSSVALDRYTFWEALMAARSVLYLSYQGRSAVDGSERPPSPVLADLMDFLEHGGAPWPVTQGSVKDFSVAQDSPTTWSPRTRRRAEALHRPVPPPKTVRGAPLETTPQDLFPEVKSSEAVLAFTAPARFHLRRVRQVTLQDEDRRGVDDEEPWSLSFLDRHAWLQEGLRRYWSQQETAWDAGAFLRQMEAQGRVRTGVFTDRDRRELEKRAVDVKAWADELLAQGWSPGDRNFTRTQWSGRPWAPEPEDRLVRGAEVLLPRLLYTEKAPIRTLIDAALRILQNPAPDAYLATLSPSGTRSQLFWGPDAVQTRTLAELCEAYWSEAVARPLPFYPDYLEAVASRRNDHSDEPWPTSLEAAWRQAKDGAFTLSENTLGRDPYAALAFSEDPDWNSLAHDLETWWAPLFLPLLGAWR